MSEINPDELLNQLQMLAKKVQAGNAGHAHDRPEASSSGQFSELIKNSINEVNDRQMKASEMAAAFELHDSNMPLSKVMIEMQKARVSFEALKQVRNKLVDAYKQVMNMPI